jgi:cyclopropane-fatty-acyl-phospholipid synthase
MLENTLEQWIRAHANPALALALVLPSGRRIELTSPAKVTITLKNLSTIRHLIQPTLSSIGGAYVEGELDIDGKIEDIVEMVISLAKSAGGDDFSVSQPSLLQRLKQHTKAQTQQAIQFHYDISNDFYKLFLDERMVYSCAYFKQATDSLEQAQLNKLDHILNKIQLQAGDEFMDIGCGWGALIVRAAQRGAKAVGVTLSQTQHDYPQALIARLGLGARCSVRLQDYRDIPQSETYNKIASVGMFEHVGRKHLPEYFGKLQSLLAHGGSMLLHGITAAQPGNKTVGRGGGDFIDQDVFPNGELPHL